MTTTTKKVVSTIKDSASILECKKETFKHKKLGERTVISVKIDITDYENLENLQLSNKGNSYTVATTNSFKSLDFDHNLGMSINLNVKKNVYDEMRAKKPGAVKVSSVAELELKQENERLKADMDEMKAMLQQLMAMQAGK